MAPCNRSGVSLWVVGLVLCIQQCQCYVAAGSGRDRPPPFMISRVARDPSIRPVEGSWLDGSIGGGGGGRISFMKSPSFHARMPSYKFTLVSDLEPQRGADDVEKSRESIEPTPAPTGDGQPEDEPPTFTPFIGARALSNMDEFLKQLRENIQAIQTEEAAASSAEIGQPERRRMSLLPGQSNEMTGGPRSNDLSHETGNLAAKPWRGVTGTGTLHGKKLSFVQPLTAEEAHLRRAGGYNPAWLWTNMGLGKRGRR